MAVVAIQVDGQDAILRAETVEVPVQRMRSGRPYAVGVAIALLTAAVAIGAVGPHVEGKAGAPATAAEACVDPAATDAPDEGATADAAESVAWWLGPRQHVWVDPGTGETRQIDVTTPRQVVDHRARAR